MTPLQTLLLIVATILVPLVWLFAWSLCRAAGDADRMIETWMEERR